MRLHRDELATSIELARQLIDREFPEYRGLPLHALGATGSSNVQYRLGDELLIRLPRQPGGGAQIEKERRWTERVGRHLPVSVPEIIGVGEPAYGYSERWCIVRWQCGEHPRPGEAGDDAAWERESLARDLAEVVIAFRELEVSAEARADQQLRRHYRGRALAGHDEEFRRNVERCKAIEGLDLDLDAALAIWENALASPGAAETEREDHQWFHGDMVAENLLLTDGRLTGLLDFGGLGLGDPTVDLHGAWELFDAPARQVFRDRVGADDAQWLRGRAWALAIALMTFPYYWLTMPERVSDRLIMAQSALSG